MNANPLAYLVGYGVAAIVMLALDATWLTLMANSFYRRLIGDIMLDGFRPAPAILFRSNKRFLNGGARRAANDFSSCASSSRVQGKRHDR